jgi:hypothetical protein
MKSYLVVEGRTDAILMRPLIETADIPNVEIVDAGGKSSAMSLGNSIAMSRVSPVAVLVDADTTDRKSIEEQQTVFADLQRYARSGISCRLFLAMPTLEEDLFPSSQDFTRIYDLKLTERQRARFIQDRKSVIKAFYSLPEANTPTTIRHGRMDRRAAQRGWGNKLLVDLFQFLKTGSVSAKSEFRRFA